MGLPFDRRKRGAEGTTGGSTISGPSIAVPELDTSVFVVPTEFGGRDGTGGVKNGEDRLIVMNSVARSIIDGQLGHTKREMTEHYVRKRRGEKVSPVK